MRRLFAVLAVACSLFVATALPVAAHTSGPAQHPQGTVQGYTVHRNFVQSGGRLDVTVRYFDGWSVGQYHSFNSYYGPASETHIGHNVFVGSCAHTGTGTLRVDYAYYRPGVQTQYWQAWFYNSVTYSGAC